MQIGNKPLVPGRRERWAEALVLPGRSDLRASLVGELAEYLGRPEKEVLERCRMGADALACSWLDASPRTADEVSRFYEQTDAYLYDLTWWHALADDQSALAQVEALEAALGYRSRKVLDFGSGIGSLGLLMARYGLDVTLAEVNATLDGYARWRFDRRGQPARFLDAGSEELPENAFDFVSAVDVLEHLPDPRCALLMLSAALRPGGALFVHLPPGADPSRPMHLWHDPEVLLRHLDEADLWLERSHGASLVMRRGPAPRYALGKGLKVLSGGENWALLSERPLGVTRLNERAGRLLARLQGGARTAGEVPAEDGLSLADAVPFLEGLVERRVLTRTSAPRPARWPSVTVIVPARDRPSETRACVRSLLALNYPPDGLEILVVDDASEPPLSGTLEDLPVRVLRLEENAGQSAARNLASGAARGEVLAFTDNDCLADPDWLRALVPALCEPGVDVAGGRVLPPPGASEGRVAAFEAARSPLDMGATGGAVGPREPVPYLPTCNLAIDRETLLRLGGFDERMLLGEDADLVWRAVGAGSDVRYEPQAKVMHRHRTRLSSFLRRRADYGSSEADLQLRHREARRTMTVPGTGTVALAALAALPISRPAGLGLASLAAVALCAEVGVKLRRLRRTGVRLAAHGVAAAVLRQHGAGLYHLGANVARYYSLPLLGTSLLWPPLRAPALVLLIVPAFVDHRRSRAGLAPTSFAGLYWLELAAYQIGVWHGCLTKGTLRPLLPALRFLK